MALNYVAVQWLVCSNAILVVISLSYCLWKHGQHESHRWGNKGSVAMTCVTAVSLHIRTPCFKPKRSPYLFTFVFCLFMHMVSLSRFQVCQNQRPAARVKQQECKHWVQRGSADWGKGLWIWARNSPQWIMKTTLVSRPPSAASGGTSALKSN